MVGEKRKHTDAGLDTASSSLSNDGCHLNDNIPSISCECFEGNVKPQKRHCTGHDNTLDGATSTDRPAWTHDRVHPSSIIGHHGGTNLSPDTEGEEMDAQESYQVIVQPCPPSLSECITSIPKRCLRCASGESGHINHILS